MYDPRFELGCFDPLVLPQHERISIVFRLVESIVYANRLFLTHHPSTPPLYMSGVVYRAEPEAAPGTTNWFRDIPRTLELGYGHCVALTAWRLAELRERGGEDGPEGSPRARVRIDEYQLPAGRVVYHVFVLHRDGTEEDPARRLGMP